MTRMTTLRYYFFLLIFPFFPGLVAAQTNDECANATPLTNLQNFCSDIEAEDNSFATLSPVADPTCFFAFSDVWYSFTATGSYLTFSVNGNTFLPSGGSLQFPSVALYEGACGNLTELACNTDFFGFNFIEIQANNLVLGQTYFLRVDAQFPGTFQYCINNFDPDPNAKGDCPDAVPLCNKDSLHIASVLGPGNDNSEMDDASCFGGIGIETSTSWFVFTIDQTGTLEFAITPDSDEDDLDFVLYRLPNGADDCTGKYWVRCMAAGETFIPSPCMGATGLNSTATDISAPPGCLDLDADAWLKFMNVTAGQAFALVVNNYTANGHGFSLTWGGTATFRGATAVIKTNDADNFICQNDDNIVFSDSSFAATGAIASWHWDFGEGASIDSANTKGPHTISYNSVGSKTVSLTVSTADGCATTVTKTIEVVCCGLDFSVNVLPACAANAGAFASIEAPGATPPLQIEWSNGQLDSIASGLASGTYSVTVSDANDCLDSLTFQVTNTVLTLQVPADTSIREGSPALTLTATTNFPSVQPIWENGDEGSTSANSTATATYIVTASSADCSVTDSVTVTVIKEKFEVPNAFSPNGDDVNAKFFPVAIGVTILEMQVFARWGELVWEGSADGWDGTINGNPAPMDVYVYHGRVRRSDGKEEVFKGDVTLLR